MLYTFQGLKPSISHQINFCSEFGMNSLKIITNLKKKKTIPIARSKSEQVLKPMI